MISVNKKLSVILEDCENYGVVVTPTKKSNQDPRGVTESKEDCVRALQSYFVDIYKKENRYSKALDWMLRTEFQPMLAQQLKDCKWQDQIYTRENIIAETKIDGNRSIWCKFKDEPIKVFSRNLSTVDYLPMDYSDKVVHHTDYNKINHEFVIDGEIVASEIPDNNTLISYGLEPDILQLNLTTALLSSDQQITLDFQELYPLKLMLFDIVMFDGEDLTDKPLSERRKYLEIVFNEMKEAGAFIERPQCNIDLGLTIEEFHKKMLMTGEEGSIVKTLEGKYCMTGSRSHSAWVKLKRKANLDDTIDGFITGFKNIKDSDINSWRVGSIEFSAYIINNQAGYFMNEFGEIEERTEADKVVRPIAYVGGLTEEEAKMLSEPDPDNPGYCRLKKEAYGMVAELTGQDFSSRSRTLMHPAIVRFRNDKPMDQCTLTEAFIDSQIK